MEGFMRAMYSVGAPAMRPASPCYHPGRVRSASASWPERKILQMYVCIYIHTHI